MSESSLTYDQLIDRFRAWAQTRDDIRAAIIIGSRARVDHPADRWSDLDVILVTSRLDRYLEDDTWPGQFGTFWFSFLERQAVGNGVERRVLFDGGLDVDFALIPADWIQTVDVQSLPPDMIAIFRRGYRFILDKDGLERRFESVQFVEPVPHPPTEGEFQDLCRDYWYHTVWTVKKLRRGEIWMAHRCANGYMSERLAQMLEWHAHAVHGATYDTWHGGRFLDRWADPRAVAELQQTFAHYDPTDIGRALLAQMNLFRRVAQETADHLHYRYSGDVDRYATVWVTESLRP